MIPVADKTQEKRIRQTGFSWIDLIQLRTTAESIGMTRIAMAGRGFAGLVTIVKADPRLPVFMPCQCSSVQLLPHERSLLQFLQGRTTSMHVSGKHILANNKK